MARIRTIKPEFFTSLTVASLTVEARLTFIGLWTHADDEGRLIADARLIKAAVWPLDDRSAADIEIDLKALTEASLMTHYEVDGRRYYAVRGWDEHQRINRPTKSRFPAPEDGVEVGLSSDDALFPPSSLSTHAHLSEPSPPERKGTGNREQGKEQGKEQGTRKRSASDDDPSFAEFWSAYPRKTDKGHARAAWTKAMRTVDSQTVVAAAAAFADFCVRDGTQPNYIPHPATWLNGERWSDERIPARASPTGHQTFRNPTDPHAAYASGGL